MTNPSAEPVTVNIHQAKDLTGFSRDRLYELARAGIVERKMLSSRTFVFDWKSLRDYIDSLPTDPEDVV